MKRGTLTAMQGEENLVPVYGPAELEVWCVGGDCRPTKGICSQPLASGNTFRMGISAIIRRIRFTRCLSTLFRQARNEGLPLDDRFLFTPHLWTALFSLIVTRGISWVDRGFVVVSREDWSHWLQYYLDLAAGGEAQVTDDQRHEIENQWNACLGDAIDVWPDAKVLTFFMRWG
jgi:hypothetical protein